MYKPIFSITNRILRNIGVVEASREVIIDAPLLPLWEKRFKEEAIVRSVHHGTHVEGNRLSFAEAQNVLMGKDVIARARDVQEVINFRKALAFLEEESVKEIDRITEQLIKKLHKIASEKIIPEAERGEFRTKSVIIRNSETGEIKYRPPASVEVKFLVREFLYWLNKTNDEVLHPILKAGIAHHELTRIHPFIECNGRVSRAVATLILFLGGYDIRKFFSLEEFYDKDAVSYYENLMQADEGNLTSWLEYFTLGVSIEFKRIKEKVLKLSKDTYLKKKLGGKQVFITERQTKIIEYIQSIGYLQNKVFGELFSDISEDTVLRDINDLIEKGIIKKVGKTKASRYIMV